MSWLDDLPATEREELYDAGRIGMGRFVGPESNGDYVTHIGNPKMSMLVVEYYGENASHDPVAVLVAPGSQPRRWFSAEVIDFEGRRCAAAVNEYADESSARRNAEARLTSGR